MPGRPRDGGDSMGPGSGSARADRARARSQERRTAATAARRARDREAGPKERTPPADPEAAARAIVLRQLTMGPRTRAQLSQALARRLIPDDVAAAILDRFEAVDLVDDEEFARQWVESRHAGRGLARRALAHELRQRGVADDTVKDAVGQVSSEDELTTARELVRRKLATMSSLEPERVTRRLAGLLARKGYSGPVAWQAIREESAAAAQALDSLDGEPLPDD